MLADAGLIEMLTDESELLELPALPEKPPLHPASLNATKPQNKSRTHLAGLGPMGSLPQQL
jgi:hypothetical protein